MCLNPTKEVIMKKLINFKNMNESIKTYADEHCEGNFSLAVRMLIKKGLVKVKPVNEGDSKNQLDLLK